MQEVLGSPKDQLDEEIREHAEFVLNQILQNLRRDGWSADTLKNSGQLMLRFWNVLEAYKDMKQSYTLEEWMTRFSALAEEARKVFGSPI
jgi:hypothetical protein